MSVHGNGELMKQPIAVPLVAFLAVASFLRPSSAEEIAPLPEAIGKILADRCFECHDSLVEKGGVSFDTLGIDWGDPAQTDLWHRTYNVVAHRQMPPPDKPQPTAAEKAALLAYLDGRLTEHTPVGGTLPRRLNGLEYRNSIRTVFQMDEFDLPPGFPKDTREHGFDTVGAALVLSPPLLDAYRTIAGEIADELFPPEKSATPVTKRTAGVGDLALSFSAATIHGEALRLASKSVDIMRSSTWPSKIEITESGTYRITVEASTFRPKDDTPMTLEIRARDLSASDRSRASVFRLIEEIEVADETPQTFTFESELYEGQTPLLRWTNAELDHDPAEFAPLLRSHFVEDRRFLAAWQEMLFPGDRKRRVSVASLRGRNGWEILQRNLRDPDLNLNDATLDSALTKRMIAMARDAGVVRNLGDTYSYHYHENGPALEIHRISVEGPFRLVEGPGDRQRREWREWSFGVRAEGESDETFADRGLRTFLPRLFRRPVDEETRSAFLEIAQGHWAEGHRFEDGMHLLLRQALVSPRFLYREMQPGKLDQHDLASRISFFLTRHPPTAAIVHHARAARLGDPALRRSQADHLLPRSPSAPMIRDFTEQWLNTRLLPEIMPDEVFGFTVEEMEIAKAETEHFFFAMLEENRPLRDFIDPNFILTSRRFAEENYDYEPSGEPLAEATAVYRDAHRKIERLPIARGGRRGGLLGMSAVMTTTANGVDTQPVLRGAWVVENILGTPLPPVPSDVPALTPDVRGATTPRELLAAHTQAADCRACHRHIDPVGFALENFDPVGGWRENWPGIEVPIDASGTLPDGSEIAGYLDFKRWLVENVDVFAECLAKKLMIYATGRVPSYAEEKEISSIVASIGEEGGGFRDLVLALIESETFRTR